MAEEISLIGIDGANPLAFLAALGAFRILTETLQNGKVSMAWQPGRTWHPVLRLKQDLDEKMIVEVIWDRLRDEVGHAAFQFSDSLKV